MRLDARILKQFKIGVFIGLRKSRPGVHSAFFIDRRGADIGDLRLVTGELKKLPAHLRKSYQSILRSKKGKPRKKTAK